MIKKLLTLVIGTSIAVASLNSHAQEMTCDQSFKVVESTSLEITKEKTVRDHFQTLGVLKSDKEVELLQPEDKQLYLMMLGLDYAKAQEIMQLFTTLPILTSPKVRATFMLSRQFSKKPIKVFLSEYRGLERKKFSDRLAFQIVSELGAQERPFVTDRIFDESRVNPDTFYNRTYAFQKLNSNEDFQLFKEQMATVASYSIPDTMTRKVAQFFNPIIPSTPEFKFISALIYRNFENIAYTFEPLNKGISKSIEALQSLSVIATLTGGVFLGTDLFIGGFLAFNYLLPLATLGAAAGLSFDTKNKQFHPWSEKSSVAKWVERMKKSLSQKKGEEQIRRELVMLSALDPEAFIPLPTVQQLKKDPNSKESKALMPSLQNKNVLSYPSVDLVRLENTLERSISLIDIESLEPRFDDVDKLSKNPFLLLSYGVELAEPQYFIVGREEVLNERFKEINEKMSLWQIKRNAIRNDFDKHRVISEKAKLIKLLSANAKENSSSWEYLQALKNAVLRYDHYLIEVIGLAAGESHPQIITIHETFKLILFQIDAQIESLNLRAQSIEQLMSALRI